MIERGRIDEAVLRQDDLRETDAAFKGVGSDVGAAARVHHRDQRIALEGVFLDGGRPGGQEEDGRVQFGDLEHGFPVAVQGHSVSGVIAEEGGCGALPRQTIGENDGIVFRGFLTETDSDERLFREFPGDGGKSAQQQIAEAASIRIAEDGRGTLQIESAPDHL